MGRESTPGELKFPQCCIQWWSRATEVSYNFHRKQTLILNYCTWRWQCRWELQEKMGNTAWIYAQIKKYGVDKRWLCRWYSDPREGIKTSLERVCLKEREPGIKPWGCPSYCSLKEKDRLTKEQSFWRRKHKGMQHCNNKKKICSRERGRVKWGWWGQRSNSSLAALGRALWMVWEQSSRTSLVVQWLRLWAPIAERRGSIPALGTKLPHAVWRGKKKKEFRLECTDEWVGLRKPWWSCVVSNI